MNKTIAQATQKEPRALISALWIVVLINILSADMKQIGGKTYGQMLIRMPDDEETSRKLADFLTQENIAFKEA